MRCAASPGQAPCPHNASASLSPFSLPTLGSRLGPAAGRRLLGQGLPGSCSWGCQRCLDCFCGATSVIVDSGRFLKGALGVGNWRDRNRCGALPTASATALRKKTQKHNSATRERVCTGLFHITCSQGVTSSLSSPVLVFFFLTMRFILIKKNILFTLIFVPCHLGTYSAGQVKLRRNLSGLGTCRISGGRGGTILENRAKLGLLLLFFCLKVK